ncbi:NAD(P)-dependent alcohol dehydrogenase [Parahaliea maris]|uniref:NAD(P)-dependent alcohol dehydrogenase n=1 Tax=Parahaliea maris TaxID=2716870 RepID=A0A5C9A5H8_9GAMM|nr:NAD(P)-dependent alcohol dehydrogenase [Parahaliea maris]TXS95339.1 NAD(P)-dependent alcohol dehydrogenase [Parahaliea maris]
MKITAAVVRQPGHHFALESCELQAPGPGEVLLELEAAGICHTDLAASTQVWPVPLPAVLGHEGVGIVRAVGEGVEAFAPGDRVLPGFGSCGQCRNCHGNQPGYCQNGASFQVHGRRLDGSTPLYLNSEPITGHFFAQSSFATHCVASTRNMVRLDPDLPPALMAPLACGVQTGMGAVLLALDVREGQAIAVTGVGTVGLAAIMAARIAGCRRIVAADINPERLALARELGATDTVDTRETPLRRSLLKLGGMDAVVDTTAVPAVIREALEGTAQRGTVLCVGVSRPGVELHLDLAGLTLAGRSVRGSIEGDADPRSFVPRMIEYYRQGLLPLEKIVTEYPFERIDEAVRDTVEGRVVKPVLKMPAQISP